LWKVFPDTRIIFDDIIIEGNKVACRCNLTGTHKGEFMDLQPTNKQLSQWHDSIFFLNNGRKNEEDDETANNSIEQHIYVVSIFRG
jgi:predicted ester cyclase